MLIVLSSNALPVLTYANSEAEELAKEILTEELENTGEHFSSEIEDLLEIEEFIGWNNNLQTLWTNNEYIVHNEENWLITIYTWDFSYGITIHDTDLDTNSSDDLLDYFKWWVNSPYNSWNIDSSYGSDFTWVFNNTARWWENDMKDYPYNYWYDIANNSVTNIENRKWPCPDGFHVPSVMEFTILFDLYYKWEYNFKNSYWWAVIIGQDGILNDLNFNYYGKHTTDNSSIIFSWNWWRLDEWYYWTSTPTSYSIFPNSSPSQWAYWISFYPNWNKNWFAIQPW